MCNNLFGIYNVGSPNRISKLEFGYLLCKKYNLDNSYIEKTFLNNSVLAASRPKEMTICNNKIQSIIQIPKIYEQL